jgi:hypothetical protein
MTRIRISFLSHSSEVILLPVIYAKAAREVTQSSKLTLDLTSEFIAVKHCQLRLNEEMNLR